MSFEYPTINLAFLGIILKVKLLAKFCLHSFEWFWLQISDAKYFSSHFQALWAKIYSYSILYSDLKKKKNTTLLLLELLGVTKVPCIMRHKQFVHKTMYIYIYIYMHHLDANKTAGEEARRQLHKIFANNIEQVLVATSHKAPTSHYENYPS